MKQKTKNITFKLMVLFSIIFWINFGWVVYSNYQKEDFEKTIDIHKEMIYNKDMEIKELTDDNDTKNKEIDNLKGEIERSKKEVSRGSTRYRTITASITHYTHTGSPTASGRMPVVGRTVACNFLPLNTSIIINGNKYVVEDRVGLDGNIIDIFVDSEAEAIQKGRYNAEVEVVAENIL